jgi:hypothetical protein
VLNEAEPYFSVPVKSRVPAPSIKVTVPVGVPEPGDFTETVAVKVTDLPNLDGLYDDLTVEAVLAFATVCVRGPDVLLSKLELPA